MGTHWLDHGWKGQTHRLDHAWKGQTTWPDTGLCLERKDRITGQTLAGQDWIGQNNWLDPCPGLFCPGHVSNQLFCPILNYMTGLTWTDQLAEHRTVPRKDTPNDWTGQRNSTRQTDRTGQLVLRVLRPLGRSRNAKTQVKNQLTVLNNALSSDSSSTTRSSKKQTNKLTFIKRPFFFFFSQELIALYDC